MTLKTIILPCEVKGRELNSKLLLGALLAERGFRVIIGSRNAIHLRLAEFERAVYLGKDVRFSSGQIVKILRGLGHVFVAHDEEAQFYYSRENYLKARVEPDVFRAAKALMAWGPDNASAWEEAASYAGTPIAVTGNGRMDLLRPALRSIYAGEAQQHKHAYGRYILISSNFSSLNHFIPNLTTSPAQPMKAQHAPGSFAAELALHRRKLFNAFLALLPDLAAAFPDITIIARPHPSENHETWRKAAEGCSNIKVTNQGDILPWLLGAEALIHNGCTTGLEAYLMDRHAVAFQPVEAKGYDLELPNLLSVKATSTEALLDHLHEQLARPNGPAVLRTAERDRHLATHIYTTPDRLASERMVEVLAAEAHNPGPDSTAMEKLEGRTRCFLRSAIKRWNSRKLDHKTSRQYSLHRFPATRRDEIEKRLQSLASALQRFHDIRVEEIGDSIFTLRQQG